jgi:hypothetical protein
LLVCRSRVASRVTLKRAKMERPTAEEWLKLFQPRQDSLHPRLTALLHRTYGGTSCEVVMD